MFDIFAILKVKRSIESLYSNLKEEEINKISIENVNKDLKNIHQWLVEVSQVFREENPSVDWDKIERITGIKHGEPFNQKEIKQILIEDQFDLKKEFDEVLNLSFGNSSENDLPKSYHFN